MRFDSQVGQEIRTWILFFVGIALAVIFAIKGNPLNPWWTLVIGAFTCTAVVVSAVQAVTGGTTDAAKQIVQKAARDDHGDGPETKNAKTIPPMVGSDGWVPLFLIRRRYRLTI